jgi:hypothetical protein
MLEGLSKTRAYKAFLNSPNGAQQYPDKAERAEKLREVEVMEGELASNVRVLKARIGL